MILPESRTEPESSCSQHKKSKLCGGRRASTWDTSHSLTSCWLPREWESTSLLQDAKLLYGTFGTILCNMRIKKIMILIYKPKCTVLWSRLLDPFKVSNLFEQQMKVTHSLYKNENICPLNFAYNFRVSRGPPMSIHMPAMGSQTQANHSKCKHFSSFCISTVTH